jgi:hypothetical protein
MPLSEEEQRLLDEMERNLYGSGHDVHSASGSSGRLSSSGIVAGFVGVALGLVLLVLGVTTQLLILGVSGFVVMFVGVVAALSLRAPMTSRPAAASQSGSSSSRPKRRGLMNRLEDRWNDGR